MAKLIVERTYSVFAARYQNTRGLEAPTGTYKGCEDFWIQHRDAQLSGLFILLKQQLGEVRVGDGLDSWFERVPHLIPRDQRHVCDAEEMGWEGAEDIGLKGGPQTLAYQRLSIAQAELGDGRGC